MIKELSIHGLRGFGQKQTIRFSVPDGTQAGSGLNVIVGANNAGKTTIIEAIRAFNTPGTDTPSFSEGRRNATSGRKVFLELRDESDQSYKISTVEKGGSSTKKEPPNFSLNNYVLQSRRYVSYEFGGGTNDRDSYIRNYQKLENNRSNNLNNFNYRIFQIQKNKEQFDAFLEQVLGYKLNWTIDQRDNGQFYIQYSENGLIHSSEGVGDGIWSIFTICDALYDAKDNTSILIDEPELSIHPALQRRLMKLFIEQSKTKQIILCTHSAYFVNWKAITVGASLIRIAKESTNSICYQISSECAKKFQGILSDLNNPHVLGSEATESLFLDDHIILVEGQEDVVIFNRIAEQLNIPIQGSFFGWGVGGAAKMSAMLHLFKDLGYKHVVAVFDGDKKEEAEKNRKEYSTYKIYVLPKDDIRDKPPCSKQTDNLKYPCYRASKEGLTTEKGQIKKGTENLIESILKEINNLLQ